jgi:hypothetical protein
VTSAPSCRAHYITDFNTPHLCHFSSLTRTHRRHTPRMDRRLRSLAYVMLVSGNRNSPSTGQKHIPDSSHQVAKARNLREHDGSFPSVTCFTCTYGWSVTRSGVSGAPTPVIPCSQWRTVSDSLSSSSWLRAILSFRRWHVFPKIDLACGSLALLFLRLSNTGTCAWWLRSGKDMDTSSYRGVGQVMWTCRERGRVCMYKRCQ